jgi:hypothetical protein
MHNTLPHSFYINLKITTHNKIWPWKFILKWLPSTRDLPILCPEVILHHFLQIWSETIDTS